MKKMIQGFFLTSALATSLMFAQTSNGGTHTPPTPADMAAHRVAFLTKVLTLTTDQQSRATSLYTASATTDATTQAGLKTAHTQLTDAVKSNNPTAIQQASSTIGALTTQLVANDAKTDAAFYQLLTADQKAKYDQLHSRGFGGPGMRGFGGSGGPMGGPGMMSRGMRGRRAPGSGDQATPQQQ